MGGLGGLGDKLKKKTPNLLGDKQPITTSLPDAKWGDSSKDGFTPLMIAALFWRGSTKWGALASTVWVAVAVMFVAVFQQTYAAPPPGPPAVEWSPRPSGEVVTSA